jgi:hypothetical protein
LKAIFLCISLACATLACAQTIAQTVAQPQELPKSLSGRWRFAVDGSSQSFSLDEIEALPDKSFTAKLTWWQYDPWCATRSVPIVGRQTESGIAFEVPRKCNIAYTVELNRAPSGWIGTASNTMRGYGLMLELKAD